MPTDKKNVSLGDYIRTRRESLGLTIAEAEERSDLDSTYWRKLEAGQYEAPSPKALHAIARTLKSPIEDLYGLCGYDIPKRLPSLSPYLRTKFDLPPEAVADLERYFSFLRAYYDIPVDKPVFPPKPKPTDNRSKDRPVRRRAT